MNSHRWNRKGSLEKLKSSSLSRKEFIDFRYCNLPPRGTKGFKNIILPGTRYGSKKNEHFFSSLMTCIFRGRQSLLPILNNRLLALTIRGEISSPDGDWEESVSKTECFSLKFFLGVWTKVNYFCREIIKSFISNSTKASRALKSFRAKSSIDSEK